MMSCERNVRSNKMRVMGTPSLIRRSDSVDSVFAFEASIIGSFDGTGGHPRRANLHKFIVHANESQESVCVPQMELQRSSTAKDGLF